MRIEKKDRRLEELACIEQSIKEQPGRKIYIWGCSCTARMLTEFCEKNSDVTMEAYVVDDVYYREDSCYGKPVCKASVWEKTVKSGDYVLIGFTNAHLAEKRIESLPAGVRGIYWHFPYSANVDGTYLDYRMYQNHMTKFKELYERLEDEHSKRVLEAFINGCASGRVEELERLKTDGQYFNSLTRDFPVKCFVDCGAYVGDTIETATEFYSDSLMLSIAFEPDINNMELLRKRICEKGIKEESLHLITKGSWKEAGVLHFSSSDSSSSITESGDVEIEVDSIDHVMSTVGQPVDFIKMDVEGSEQETLLGAAATIAKDHPILAVCVYHKPEDLLVLPQMIMDIAGNDVYKLYLQYHGPDLRELVLYAIPIR